MKVLVLAGGFDQKALINYLKEDNHEVILLDYLDNPPAKEDVEKHYKVSTLDTEAVKEIAIKEQADLITTACTDQALLTVAKVSEELNLPCYISYEKALNVTNKLYMKKKFIDSNIPTSKYKIIENIDELDDINLNYPIVVKPVDCNSSKGVKKVLNKEELKIATEEAINLSRTNNAIVEEYKEGAEFSVDVFIKDSKATVLSITQTNKVKNNNNNFTIYQSEYPGSIKERQKQEIEIIANQIATSFDLNNCPMLIQLIGNDEEINVLEFSARMGGGTKYKLIETISGVNIMKEYTNLVLSKPYKIEPNYKVNYVLLNYVYCENGRYIRLENFDLLKEQGYIEDYFVYKTPGSIFTGANNSGDRVAGYLITASTKEEIKEKEDYIKKTIKVIGEDGQNMIKYNY